jgi:hypothetical protein
MADAGKSTLPVDLLRQIDALCAEFERAWKGDESPPIEDYVPRVPEQARPTAL